MADAVVKSETLENAVESYTTCYICLEQLKSSKCLPCNHMFCRDCLKQYIEKQQQDLPEGSSLSAFPCPVCRQNTLPTAAGDNITAWADGYPSSDLVSSIEQSKALKVIKKMCKFCQAKGDTGVTANLWCKNCNVFYCNKCKLMHDVLHDDHDVRPVKEIKENPFSTIRRTTVCRQHGETSKLFCDDHQESGCQLCMSTRHRNCQNILVTKDVAMTIKEKKEIEALVDDLDVPIADVSGLSEIAKGHLTILEEGKNAAEDQIEMIMEEVKEHFLEKVTKLYKEGKEKNESKLKRCKQLKFALTHLRSSLLTALQVGDDADVVMMKTSGKTQLQKYCSEVHEEFMQNKIERLTVLPEVTANLKQIEIAKNTVDFYNQSMPLTNRKTYPFTVKLQKSIDVSLPGDGSPCNITSVLFYKKDRIIAVDSANSSIKLVSESGEHLSHLSVPGCKLWGVCQMSPQSFAVTCGSSMKILMVNVYRDKLVLKNTVNIDNPVYGIAYAGCSFVGTDGASPSMIREYSTKGKELHSITGLDNMRRIVKLPKSGQLVASRGSDVPMTKNDQSAEVVLMAYSDFKSQPGKPLVTAEYQYMQRAIINLNQYYQQITNYNLFPGSLRNIDGLTADEFDNILFVGTGDDNIARLSMMSLEGQQRSPSTQSDVIQSPSAISFNQSRFVLSQKGHNLLKLYSMF